MFWNEITQDEKDLIARDTDRMRAYDKFLCCLQAIDEGREDDAINLAGEVRSILRVLAHQVKMHA